MRYPGHGLPAAGYESGNVGSDDFDLRWVYDDTLSWKMCLESVDGHSTFATARLSSDADGDVTVKLQRCVTSDFYMVGNVEEDGVDHGNLSTGRYRFDTMITPETTQSSSQGYRITITTYLAYVQDHHRAFVPISLSSGGPDASATFSTGCFDS